MDDGEAEEGQQTPGEEAVRRVPKKRAGSLRAGDGRGSRDDATKNGIVYIEIEDLVGMRAGAGIGTHHHIALMEAATQTQLESVVVVVTRVLQNEVAARQIVGCVVNKVVRATPLHEFSFHEEGCRKFLFECNTPIQKVRSLEVLVVNREGGENRRWGWGDCATEIRWLAGGVEEVILPLSGVRTRNQDEVGGVVDDADPS